VSGLSGYPLAFSPLCDILDADLSRHNSENQEIMHRLSAIAVVRIISSRCAAALIAASVIFTTALTIAEEPKSPFRIGFVVPLSGPTADFGFAIQSCVDLARRDRPELSTNTSFLFEDVATDPKAAISAFRKLVDAEKVDITVVWGVTFCKAISPLAETLKTPMVGLCLDQGIAVGRHYVIRFANTLDEIMGFQAGWLNDRGLKKIGILQAEHPYLEELTQAFKRNLRPGQTFELIDRILNTDMDQRSQILKILRRKSDFDAIGALLAPGQVSTFHRQARTLGLSLPIFGSNFSESSTEIEASNGAMNNLVFSSIAVKEPFFKRYRDKFNRENALGFGAMAYEFATTAGELFNRNTSKLSAAEVVQRLASVGPREGVAAGPYRYINTPSTGQYFQFPVTIKKIQDGHFSQEGG
jgi:ABC-type branched-subunit amino acid transport system substrate-binding protein